MIGRVLELEQELAQAQQRRLPIGDNRTTHAPTTAAIPVEQRFLVARDLARGAGVFWVPQRRVDSTAAAQAEMERIVSRGGEGVVVRKPGSYYEFGCSSSWLKVKPQEVNPHGSLDGFRRDGPERAACDSANQLIFLMVANAVSESDFEILDISCICCCCFTSML